MWKFLISLALILALSSSIEVRLECKTDIRLNEEIYCWLTNVLSSEHQVTVTESSFNVTNHLQHQQPINIIFIGNENYPEYFPKNLTQYLTGVSGFMYDDTSLKYIQRNDFTALASNNPLILHLRSNEIEVIPYDTFYDLINLLYLDMSSNRIKSLPSNLLINSVGLHSLSISGNDLTELHHNLFINCPQFYDLTAEFNQIQDIHVDLFRNNPNMTSISMMDNKIRNINVDFRKLKFLKFADFRNNFESCDVIFSTLTPDDKDFDEVDQRKAMTNIPKFQRKIEKVCKA
ncbi:leucine-rich repeat-containing protein 15-like [Chironomus tepperi]|uniref:leucine-rich repeat-containing protein 15-like n=1 Tax=Chironomus tepperi TaxID=113505 RepID=UPI00391F2701